MDDDLINRFAARLQSKDDTAFDEWWEYVKPTVHQMIAKAFRETGANRNQFLDGELENAAHDALHRVSRPLLTDPYHKWKPRGSAGRVGASLKFAIRHAIWDVLYGTELERGWANDLKKLGEHVPSSGELFSEDDDAAARYNNDLEILEVMEELQACCKDAIDLAIVTLGAEGNTPEEIAVTVNVAASTIYARRAKLYQRYKERDNPDSPPRAKVERASAVERASGKANGVEITLSA